MMLCEWILYKVPEVCCICNSESCELAPEFNIDLEHEASVGALDLEINIVWVSEHYI